MNLPEKDQFVHQIMSDLKHEILKRVDRMPEEWDGHEIRQFILDYYSQNYLIGDALRGKRKKEYKNTILIENLT